MSADTRTPQQLVRFLRGRGLSNAEIAVELQRSPRMVSKILNGETSGGVYRTTLLELATTGRASTVPPRRRGRNNELVRVRGKGGAGAASVAPADTGGRYTNERQGGRLRSTTYLAEGGRQHELHIPKSKTAKGRDEANALIMDAVRSAARGQARENQKQVRARITFANGRVMEVNPYNASTMLQRINESGSDALSWFREESAQRYTNLDVSKTPITGISLTVHAAPKTPTYFRNKAAGRERQSRS